MTVDIHFSPTWWWVIDHNYDVNDIINCWLAILPHSCNRFYVCTNSNKTEIQWAKNKKVKHLMNFISGMQLLANACLCNWAKWTARKKKLLQQLKSGYFAILFAMRIHFASKCASPASSMFMFNLYVKYQSLFAMTNGFCAEWFWWMVATEQRLNLIEYNNKCFFCFPTKRNRLSCTVKLIEHIWLFW